MHIGNNDLHQSIVEIGMFNIVMYSASNDRFSHNMEIMREHRYLL